MQRIANYLCGNTKEMKDKLDFYMTLADQNKNRIDELKKIIKELSHKNECFNCGKVNTDQSPLKEFDESLKKLEGYKSFLYCDRCSKQYIIELENTINSIIYINVNGKDGAKLII